MIPTNPGNLLPFFLPGYNDEHRPYHRHRQIGTDQVPYGILASRTRLMPFQFYTAGAEVNILGWELISAVDDTTTVTLDETTLTKSVMGDDSGFWVTWDASAVLDTIPDCGYWYSVVEIEGVGKVYSEVMYLTDLCGLETAGLEISPDSCANGTGNFSFTLAPVINAATGYVYTIERFNAGWSVIATNDDVGLVESDSPGSRQYRIVCTTLCGVIITTTYTATWDTGDPCGTISLGAGTTTTNLDGIAPGTATWRLTFTHSTDKGQVLYQNGYTQWLFLPAPVWDRPEITRTVERTEDGNGNETLRFSRTVTRQGFEFADCPDWLITFLAKCGDLNTIVYEDVLTGVSFPVTNVTFESREQGPALNVGRIYFDAEIETFADCQENFDLA